MKFLAAGAEFFHADRQTDVTKLIFAFRNFAKRPKNPSALPCVCVCVCVCV